MSDKYISKDNLELAIDGLKVGITPDWNENDKSAIGYIENRPFYTEYGVIVDNYSGSGKLPKCNFVVGNTYDVIWNGVTYKGLVCRTDGEYNFIGGDRYPFYIDNDGGNGFYVEPANPESGFIVSILGDIVHQLDEKYIPDSVARVEDVEEAFISFADSFDESINNLETTLNNKISTNSTNITINKNNITTLQTKIDKKMAYEALVANIPNAVFGYVCYGDGKYVFLPLNSSIGAYSTDGIKWTKTTLPVPSHWKALAYGNGKFVGITNKSEKPCIAIYSADGIKWNKITLSEDYSGYEQVVYGNGKFVAISNSSKVISYSTNGITWNHTPIPSSNNGWFTLCYGNGKFVSVSTQNEVIYSTDGIAWELTSIQNPDTNSYPYKLVYGDGKFVLTTMNTTTNPSTFYYSEDGINWESTTVSLTGIWEKSAYGNGKFISIARTSANAIYSEDGINWMVTTMPSKTWFDVTFGGDKFIAVGESKVAYSFNGIDWYTELNQITQNNEDITDKVKDLILPISTNAQVGQLLSVKAVDENGKPTEWETLDPVTIFEEFGFTVDENGTLVGGAGGGGVSDEHINNLINAALSAIPNASEVAY